MPSLPVTSATAVFASILILVLTVVVVQLRRKDGVVLGDNDDRRLTKAIRGQANATEQLPIALIVMGLAELQGGATAPLVLSAITLVIGRSAHALYFAVHGINWRFRFYGMWLTVIAQAMLVLTLIVSLST